MIDITTTEELSEAIERSQEEPVVLYKHSNRCALSRRAQKKIADLAPPGDPRVYRVTVQTHRELSDQISARFDIRHETPQVIILDKTQPVFTTSHRQVSAETVRTALQNHSQPTSHDT